MIAIEAITASENARRSPSSRRATTTVATSSGIPDEEGQRPRDADRQAQLVAQRDEREANGLDEVA